MKKHIHKLCINDQEYALLRNFIEEHSGISLGDNKAYLIENRLPGLVFESGCKSFGDFYLKLKHGSNAPSLIEKAIDLITTNETLWFRDKHPFDSLEKHVFPELRDMITAGRRSHMDIWSAACATGQEPYSIAMKAIDFYKQNGGTRACGQQVRILATDISRTAITTAKAGLYDTTAMKRGLDPNLKEAYFKPRDKMWMITEEVKQLVTFREHNLKSNNHRGLGPFDIIFLRNIIIYFSDDFKKAIFEKMARLLKPGGYLFLGNGETVSGYTNAFEKVTVANIPFYRLSAN